MKDPATLAKPGNEDSHQIAVMAKCAQWQRRYPELRWLFHVPNGEQRSAITGARLKAAGVKPGVADLLWLVPRRGYHGLCLELKHDATGLPLPTKERMVSPLQKEFLTFEEEQGYCCGVAYGYEEAIRAIAWYGGLDSD